MKNKVQKRNFRLKAYTLLELMVVLTIIGILLSAGMAAYIKIQESAMKKAAEIELNQYPVAILNFKLDQGKFPNNPEEMLEGGYITKELAADSWNTPYQIEYNESDHTIKISSAGPDQKFGTKDDLVKEEKAF